MKYMEEINRCAEILKNSQRLLVLNGAGISAESGMGTYRGPDGEYSKNPNLPIVLSADVFTKDRYAVWKRIDDMRVKASVADPNEAHRILAEWEGEGRFDQFLIATQNIDGLHQKAGSTQVSQLHGSIWEFARPREVDFTQDPQFAEDMALIQYSEIRDEILQRWSEENRQIIWEDRTVPFTEIPPDSDPSVRPNVLLYDESYGSRLLWVEDFISRKPDLVLVIGCSGGVSILDHLLRSCRTANPDCEIININPHEDCVSMPHHYLPLKATVAMERLDSSIRLEPI